MEKEEKVEKAGKKAKAVAVTVYDIEVNRFIKEFAARLKEKKEFAMPQWASFVKTAAARERPPAEPDWWWLRAASILRQLYIRGSVGVSRLRRRYGGRKKRGMKPAKFHPGAGKIIRTILQQAEAVGFVEKEKEKPGRKLTAAGKEFMNKLAAELKGK